MAIVVRNVCRMHSSRMRFSIGMFDLARLVVVLARYTAASGERWSMDFSRQNLSVKFGRLLSGESPKEMENRQKYLDRLYLIEVSADTNMLDTTQRIEECSFGDLCKRILDIWLSSTKDRRVADCHLSS